MKRLLFLAIILSWAALSADLDFGKDLYNDQLYEEAIKEFEAVVAYSPTSEAAQEAIFYTGKCYWKRGQYALAENSFRKITEGFPNNTFRDEVLFNLASVQVMQKKYDEATLSCDELLSKYPLSNFTEQSLSLYLTSLYELQEYNRALERGRKFLRDYENSAYLPDVLLNMAKICYAANLVEEGQQMLDRISQEYPNHNAAWQGLEMQVELTEKSAGVAAAAELLEKKMSSDIPRLFEEPLRLKLALYQIELKRYLPAYQQLDKLINKFNNSADLDHYIVLYAETQLHLDKAQQVIDDYAGFKKVFRDSPLQAEYLLKIAAAYIKLNDSENAQTFIENAKAATNDAGMLYRCDLQTAGLRLQEGQLMTAIGIYQKLLDSPFAERNEILLLLGDIYFEKMVDFPKAENYYNRIISGYAPTDILNEALYKVALCYENQDKNDQALEALQQIDTASMNDADFQEKVLKRLDYLKKFKQKDYENAFNSLLESIVTFSENSDKQALKSAIIAILSQDLKNYEQALQILENDDSDTAIYNKAKLLLQLADKHQAESKNNLMQRDLADLQELTDKLDPQQQQRWISELNLKRDLIEERKVTSQLAENLNDYIHNYPQGESANEFRYQLYLYYQEQNDVPRSAIYAAVLENDGSIPETGFYAAKITLAEDYYAKDQNDQALRNYRLADSYIDLKRPQIYYHYAVTLNETGNTTEARDKLAFLINNGGHFAGFDNVINYFCNILRSIAEYDNVIKYMRMLPEEQQNDKYWKQLAEDYLISGDVENGKIALMHIVNKDYETLSRLGQLQYESGELEMAKYTFTELTERNKDDLKNYEILGRIAFQQEEYLETAQNYKVIIDKLGEKYAAYKGIKQVALENIIALYRIDNRPKAERLTDQFRKMFSDEEINQVELNRGIYQKKLDKKKALGIFTSLIKGKKVDNSTRIQAYFWRGVTQMEQNDLTGAEEDFTTVANSIDKDMSNQAHLKLGTINFSNEKYEEALEHYYKVIENDENGALAFDAARNFAYVCKTIEEWQKAIAAYQIILERWGDQKLEAQTIFDIAYCYYRDRKFKDAADMFARAIPLLKDDEVKAEAQYWIGESYFGMEDYVQSISEFLKVGYEYPKFTHWAASAELKAGEAYLEMNKKTKARQMYERIIDKYGRTSQWGTEAQKRLENL
ncbi:MAG TPA: tetratricopeptide repeat protein [Candidatus Cloacimonadota bacterium]|nr:tetratricopeptide repeat protein [Candidatus Cloacimonadota bacterium]